MPFDRFIGTALCGVARALTGMRALWLGCTAEPQQRVYFANHSSHGDFVLIWSALPPALREHTRPVAAADYWLGSALRRYVIEKVFRGVLIDRRVSRQGENPVAQMGAALAAGDSLILFPEGTRNQGEGLLPLKSGIFHLARAHPQVELVPVWIENLGRAMPKGTFIPVPLLCTLSFGSPLRLQEEEGKEAFLGRLESALLSLRPPPS